MRLRPTTVLVVDDDPVFSFELGSSLRAAGYCVVCAEKASEAYVLLERQKIDLAIVDLNLPDKSGLEVVHEASRLRMAQKLLAVTGALSDLHLEIAKYMGADLAVRKFPGDHETGFAQNEWVDTVKRLLAATPDNDARGSNARR